MSTKARSFIHSAKWLLSNNALRLLLQIPVSVLLARLILPTVFGEYFYMLAWVEYLSLLTGFGFNTSILQNSTHPQKGFENTGFWLAIVCSLFYLAVGSSLGFLVVPRRMNLYIGMVLAKTLFMSAGVHSIILQKSYRFKLHTLINLLATIAGSITACTMALRGFPMGALVAQFIVTHVIIAMSYIACSPFDVQLTGLFHPEYVRTFFRNGKDIFISQMMDKVLATADNILIRHLSVARDLAYYCRARSLPTSILATSLLSMQPLFSVSFAEKQKDAKDSEQSFSLLAWGTFRFSSFLSLVCACTAPEWMPFLYGNNWAPAEKLLPLLALFIALAPLKRICRTFLLANGSFRQVRSIQILEAFAFVAALIFGKHLAGLPGICLALSASGLPIAGLYMKHIQAVIPTKPVKVLALPLFCFPAMFLLNAWLRTQACIASMDGLTRAAAIAALTSLLMAALLLIFEAKDLKHFLKKLKDLR